jgi:hypothetical protein
LHFVPIHPTPTCTAIAKSTFFLVPPFVVAETSRIKGGHLMVPSGKAPAGDDLVVERLGRQKKKASSSSKKKASPSAPPVPSLETTTTSLETTTTKPLEAKASTPLLGALLGNGENEEEEGSPAQQPPAQAQTGALPDLLLSSGMLMEGEEDEEEMLTSLVVRTATAPSSGEEGDSLEQAGETDGLHKEAQGPATALQGAPNVWLRHSLQSVLTSVSSAFTPKQV